MSGTIDFSYDLASDVVIARPKWTLESRDDIVEWHQAWIDGLKPYSRRKKPDVVVLADEFRVTGEAVKLWGQYRADLNNNYLGISYRVNSDPTVRVTVLTSGARYSAQTAEAMSVEDAIEGILSARKAQARK